MFKKFFLVLLVFFSVNLSALSIEKLNFNGFVADSAQVISDSSEVQLNALLYDLQQKTKADIAVVTLNSLNNRPIEDVSLEIGRKYKIGSKELNNGAVVLVVPNDREARIEVGYGLEGAITDSHAGRILDDYMIPYFRENNYEQGIVDGTTALAVDVAESYGVQIDATKPVLPESEEEDFPITLALIIVMLTYLPLGGAYILTKSGNSNGRMISGNYRPSNFSSHSSSSSSSSSFGGGGGFGGGGSSRKW